MAHANVSSLKKNEPQPEQHRSVTAQQDTEVMELFEYERLEFPSHTMRLIELEKGHPGSELRCQIEVFRFREDDYGSDSPVLRYRPAPPFEALSYCWGDDTANHSISLQGRRKFVTASLDHILRALRQPQSSRWLWIDQLCINQQEETPYEKAPQILLMTKIYTRAYSVPIWIGRASESTQTAISGIEAACLQKPSVESIRFGIYKDTPPGAIRDRLKAAADGFNDAMLMSYYLRSVQDYSMLPSAGSEGRNAIVGFFNREWFFRCWTFQEVVLSGSATIYCGKHTVTWADAAWVAALLEHVPDAFYKGDELAGVHAAKTTWFYQLSYLSAKSTPPLLELLATGSGHTRATDASDKIFGYLGIAKETAGKEISEVHSALRPRYADLTPYNLPLEEKLKRWENWAVRVYTDLAFYYIDTTTSLAILSHVHHTASSALAPNCPSWVPRWNRERPRYQIWQYQDTPQTGFRANGKMKLVDYAVRESAGSVTLDLRGRELFIVDKVSGILSEADMTTPTTVDQEPSPDYRWIWKLSEIAQCLPLEEEEMRKESMILTAGRRGFGHDPMGNGIEETSETEHVNDYAALLTLLCRQELADPTRVGGGEWLAEAIEELAPKAAAGNGVAFGKQAMRACEGRRFFGTQGGRVGLAPSGTQPLDSVCVLSGGQVPYILRPVDAEPGFFTLVGECFMPEIMFGEGMESNEGDLGEYMLFHIR
ncbi:heterokaryon incompatibility protein-domain-containing protein [Cadophora sp. MPI-SDFR-AT-0126]|nr:heterokaryon incompatibility protein-domain-containing protein [Leotiomycetes sp. MPI-SDFR-AT-0126]